MEAYFKGLKVWRQTKIHQSNLQQANHKITLTDALESSASVNVILRLACCKPDRCILVSLRCFTASMLLTLCVRSTIRDRTSNDNITEHKDTCFGNIVCSPTYEKVLLLSNNNLLLSYETYLKVLSLLWCWPNWLSSFRTISRTFILSSDRHTNTRTLSNW